MLIISAGMQKSGSAYIYNLINDLLISAEYPDARKLKKKYSLEKELKWYNNNIGDLDGRLLLKLLLISFKEKKYAVKTHSAPTKFLNILLKLRFVKIIYIYRDPRDVLLSAMDHGRTIIDQGENHTFAQMVDFETAIINIKKWIDTWRIYNTNSSVLCVKYEDLLSIPFETLYSILEYLNINVSKEIIEKTLYRYSKDNDSADMRGLHFNKAKINRFKDEFTVVELGKLKDELENQITEMGYKV